MAQFTPKKIDITKINNGNEYQNGDGIQPSTLNDVIEGIAYTDENKGDADYIHQVVGNVTYDNKTYSLDMQVISSKSTTYDNSILLEALYFKNCTGKIVGNSKECFILNSGYNYLVAFDYSSGDTILFYHPTVTVTNDTYTKIEGV